MAFVTPTELSGVASLRDAAVALNQADNNDDDNNNNNNNDDKKMVDGDDAQRAVNEAARVLYMCVASVLYRKARADAEPHPTNTMTRAKLAHLPFTFLRMLEPHPAALSLPFVAPTAPAPPAPFVAKVRQVLASAVSASGKGNKRKQDDDDNNSNTSGGGGDGEDAELTSWGLGAQVDVAALVKAAHRPLPELADELAALLARSVVVNELPPIGSYIGCTLTLESQTALTDALAPSTKGWNQHATHVTLVHSHNYAKQSELWTKAAALTGVTVRITPRALYDNADAALTGDDFPQVCRVLACLLFVFTKLTKRN
jgi:hypothetical protein